MGNPSQARRLGFQHTLAAESRALGAERRLRVNSWVIHGGEVLCKVVTSIALAGFPVDFKLALFDLIAYPVELHVHCARALLFD
jgi:hypothetical protein